MQNALRIFLAALTLTILIVGISYAYTPSVNVPWQQLQKGFEYRSIPLRTYEKGVKPLMYQVRIDPRRYQFHMVVGKDYGQTLTTVSTLRKKVNGLFAINASFFDEHCELLGYHSQGARVINPNIAAGNVLTGILVITPTYSRVWNRDDFSCSQAEVAFQTGPRLIVDGKPTQGLHGAPTRVSGVAIDKQQRLILYATSADGRLTLPQVQSVLMDRVERGGVQPYAAINLDGGSSTGFSLATDALSMECPSMALVASALAVTPRPNVK